jgi:hypothetical protein
MGGNKSKPVIESARSVLSKKKNDLLSQTDSLRKQENIVDSAINKDVLDQISKWDVVRKTVHVVSNLCKITYICTPLSFFD